MNEFDEQQKNTVTQQRQNRGQDFAVASLILGILSILLLITIIFPLILGILAIVFGVLSLKNQKKGLALAGIVTGAIGLVLAIMIIIIGIASPSFLENDPNNLLTAPDSSYDSQNNAPNDSRDSNDRMKTFYGDGFELKYSGLLWTPITGTRDDSDETVHALEYIIDGTTLIPSGVSGMLGYSTATRAECDDMYKAFYDLYVSIVSTDVDAYVVGETETFKILKDDVYCAAYSIYGKDDVLLSKAYVIASESNDIVVSFVTELGSLTKAGPDIPIMPVLESITFTARTAFADSYEQKVWKSDDGYSICDYAIPSLSKIMDGNSISYTYTEEDKIIGKMVVPSILNYFETPEKIPVEIIEITYNDVDDVWGAIDAYGSLLSETYDFYVTYPPTEYPNYGEDYRFCELIKDTDGDKSEIIYVAAIYSQDENIIKVQFGTIETAFSSVKAGIGALNLETIKQEGMKP